MSTAAESIRELTLPVVLISANGLICLALYNRLAAITARLRSFCREQFEMRMKLTELETCSHPPSQKVMSHLVERLKVLEEQRSAIFRRALQLRNGLILLLASIVGMLLSSLLLGIALEFSLHPAIPLTAFVLGTLAMISGIGFAIRELIAALDPVSAEEPTNPWETNAHSSRRTHTLAGHAKVSALSAGLKEDVPL